MKNKRGQFMLAVLFAVVFFIFGMLIFNFLGDEVTNAKNSLECSSVATISDGTKLTCLVGDTTVIYWIWAILSISLGGILSRFL